MGCCGQIKNIVNGSVAYTKDTLFKKKIRQRAGERIDICRKCEHVTWMKKTEYAAWLLKNGIKVLQNFTHLEKLPPLLKQNTGKNPYCRLCKCWIPGKAYIDEENCPKGLWKK